MSFNISKKIECLFIVGFWLFIALISYVQDIVATKASGHESNLIFTLIVCVGPILWIPFTPLVRRLSMRFPFSRQRITSTLAIHFALAVMISLSHLIIEGSILYLLITYLFKREGFQLAFILVMINTRMVIYFLIVGVTQGIEYFRKFRLEELKSSKLQNELSQSVIASLKMQIQPHFLFNTHHAIVGLMLKNENRKAIEMLTKLSELLRFTLDKGNLQMIRLVEEVEFLKLYLDIQEIRFNNRLQVEYEIDPEATTAMIPMFLFQPLVENSIRHGISPRSEAGCIKIAVKVIDHEWLHIEIADDGIGLNGHYREGIGIGNIKARLSQIYDGDFSFLLSSTEPKGTSVKIIIPKKGKHL